MVPIGPEPQLGQVPIGPRSQLGLVPIGPKSGSQLGQVPIGPNWAQNPGPNWAGSQLGPIWAQLRIGHVIRYLVGAHGHTHTRGTLTQGHTPWSGHRTHRQGEQGQTSVGGLVNLPHPPRPHGLSLAFRLRTAGIRLALARRGLRGRLPGENSRLDRGLLGCRFTGLEDG